MDSYGEAIANCLERNKRKCAQIPVSATGESPAAAELAAVAVVGPEVVNPLHDLVRYLSSVPLKELLDDFVYMPMSTFVLP